METYLLIIVMLVAVSAVCVIFKGKDGIVAAVSIAMGLVLMLIAGQGIQLRVATEGAFVYVDTLMWVLCGMAFAHILYKNGTFAYLFQKIMSKKRGSFVQMLLLVLFIALPGMLTGTIMASVATTGYLAGRYLLDRGVEKTKVVEVVGISSLLGMILPPLCLPAMATVIARQGIYPGSFEGYFLIMLCVGMPLALIYVAMAGGRILGGLEADTTMAVKGSAICLVPLVTVVALLLAHNFLYKVTPFLGYPLIYVIGFALAIFFGCQKINPITAAADGMPIVATELAMILAMACAFEVFSYAGVNGTIATLFTLNGLDDSIVMITVLFGLAIVALGAFVGVPAAYVMTALAVYQCTDYYTQLPMVGLGLCVVAAFVLARKGNITDLVTEQLEVGDVTNGQVVKPNLAIVTVLVLLAIVIIVASDALSVLVV